MFRIHVGQPLQNNHRDFLVGAENFQSASSGKWVQTGQKLELCPASLAWQVICVSRTQDGTVKHKRIRRGVGIHPINGNVGELFVITGVQEVRLVESWIM